jgi:hypothetical protein
MLREANCSTQSRSTSTNDDGVVRMINNRVSFGCIAAGIPQYRACRALGRTPQGSHDEADGTMRQMVRAPSTSVTCSLVNSSRVNLFSQVFHLHGVQPVVFSQHDWRCSQRHVEFVRHALHFDSCRDRSTFSHHYRNPQTVVYHVLLTALYAHWSKRACLGAMLRSGRRLSAQLLFQSRPLGLGASQTLAPIRPLHRTMSAQVAPGAAASEPSPVPSNCAERMLNFINYAWTPYHAVGATR